MRDIDLLIEARGTDAVGQVALHHLASDLRKIEGAFSTPDGALAAFDMLCRWEQQDPLRKGIAGAILMRAKSLLVPAIERAGAAASKWQSFRQKFVGAASDAGEAVGRWAASSPATHAAERVGISVPSVERTAQAGRAAFGSAAQGISSGYSLRHAAEGAAVGAAAFAGLRHAEAPKAPAAPAVGATPRQRRNPV